MYLTAVTASFRPETIGFGIVAVDIVVVIIWARLGIYTSTMVLDVPAFLTTAFDIVEITNCTVADIHPVSFFDLVNQHTFGPPY